MNYIIAYCLLAATESTPLQAANGDKNVIQGHIDQAVSDFRAIAEQSRKLVLEDLDSAADRAHRTGHFETLTLIRQERADFESFGVVPTSLPTDTFDRRMANARKRLRASYRAAIESFTRAGNIDAAMKTQRELKNFQQDGLVRKIEIGLLDSPSDSWKLDNASLPHWSVRNGVLRFDGTRGEKATLYTQRSFRHFSFRCEWRIGPGGDSGIFLRGVPQVQIWDHTRGKGKGIGSGGLYNNRNSTNAPSQIADKPIGQWNSMTITLIGDRATVTLNGQRVTDNCKMENHPNHRSPLPSEGPIGLQAFHSQIEFRNLMVVELP